MWRGSGSVDGNESKKVKGTGSVDKRTVIRLRGRGGTGVAGTRDRDL